jgi:hypothetical protein
MTSAPGPNEIDLPQEDYRLIRHLSHFDMTMLLSEIHDHEPAPAKAGGWPHARRTLSFIANQPEYKFLKKPGEQDHA